MKFSLTMLLLFLFLPVTLLAASPSTLVCDYAIKQCDLLKKRIPEFTAVAEVAAKRHLAGGLISFEPFSGQSMPEEFFGRAGNMMDVSFDLPWKKTLAPGEKSQDIVLVAWERRVPTAEELARLKELKAQGAMIIGIGPKTRPGMEEQVELCDAFFDSGTGADDHILTLPNGIQAGHGNVMINAAQGWVFFAEFVAAITRHGKMKIMHKSDFTEDGAAWAAKYPFKEPFHSDLTVAPIPAGKLAAAYLANIRSYIVKFRKTQLKTVTKTATMLVKQMKEDGKPILVLTLGHMPYTYVGKTEDARWVKQMDFYSKTQTSELQAENTQGKLIFRLGYFGELPDVKTVFKELKLRLIYISAGNPRKGWEIPEDRLLNIDLGIPFGDACTVIPDYPIKVFPASGIMQDVAYEALNVEMLKRLPTDKNK